MADRYFLYPNAVLGSLVVWDMEEQRTLGQLEGQAHRFDVVAARGSLAVICQCGIPVVARVWNLETMQYRGTLLGGPDDAVKYSACCMEGSVLLGQGDGVIRVWDVSATAPVALASLEGHTSVVCDIKAAAAGSMVLSASHDKTVRLWDLRTSNKHVRTMKGHSLEAFSVDMDGSCRTAASGSADKTVKLWDLGSGRCMETYEGHDHKVTDVVMHESGSSFMSYGKQRDGKGIVNAWAVGSTRAIMRADMTSFRTPDATYHRLFASRDMLTVAFCSISDSQMGLSVWK